MAADYDMTNPSGPIPPPPPSPPPSNPSERLAQALGLQAPGPAQPKVTSLSVTARRVLFVDNPKGTCEVTVSLGAEPDPSAAASASLDRLWLAARTKIEQYLGEMG